MRICLIAPEPAPSGGISYSIPALATLLASRHQVVVIRSGMIGEPLGFDPAAAYEEFVAGVDAELGDLSFCCPDHRDSAAVMATMRRIYGGQGPDYIEVPDFRAHGIVPLQARLAGDRLLAQTVVGVRIAPSTELQNLHDETLEEPGRRRLAQLEREQMRLADFLLGAGPEVLDVYRRYYGDSLPAERVALGTPVVPVAHAAPLARADTTLQILYAGDLRRRDGALDLAEACQGLPAEGWALTMIGADTDTASMGQSARMTIEAMGGDDPRLRIEPATAWEQLQPRLPSTTWS